MHPGRSFVNEQRRFVMWTHPKCASTSLKSWFGKTLGYRVAPNENGVWCFWRGPLPADPDDHTVHQMAGSFPHYRPEIHLDFFHFTVVRNPLARLVSHYRQEADFAPSPAYNLILNKPPEEQRYDTFRQFAEIILGTPPEDLNPHVAPLSPSLEGAPLTRTLRLEEIDAEWPPLMRQLGLPDDPLVNRWPRNRLRGCCVDWPQERFFQAGLRPDWQDYYDPPLRKAVCDCFREDLERWYWGVLGWWGAE